MTRQSRKPKLTDEDVAEILLSGEQVSTAELARRFDRHPPNISAIRGRKTAQSIRVALALGLIPQTAPRKCWVGSKGRTVVASATKTAARAGGQLAHGWRHW